MDVIRRLSTVVMLAVILTPLVCVAQSEEFDEEFENPLSGANTPEKKEIIRQWNEHRRTKPYEPAVFFGNKETADAHGPNYQKNYPRFIRMVDSSINQAVRFLLRNDVSSELKLTAKQLAELRAADASHREPADILVELLGSSEAHVIGNLDDAGMDDLVERYKPHAEKVNQTIRTKIEVTLSKSQFKRFKQIYLQEALLLRKFRQPDPSGFGWNFSEDELVEFQRAIKQSGEDFASRYRLLVWERHKKAVDLAFGDGTVKEKLGPPSDLLKLPKNAMREKSGDNPRRGSR